LRPSASAVRPAVRPVLMQDPYFAVKEEVEHSLTVVVDLHKRWMELSVDHKRGDEFEWTSSELLSGLRSIEWDLQDLEDTVSIVEGNRQKFQLEESELQERKQFIEATRRQIVAMRDEVQGQASNETPGFSTAKRSTAIPSIGSKKQGYGKVGSQEDEILGESADVLDAEGSSSHGAPVQLGVSDAADEILGGDLEGGVPQPPHKGRHRRKKACIAVSVLMVVALALAAALFSGTHASHALAALPAAHDPDAVVNASATSNATSTSRHLVRLSSGRDGDAARPLTAARQPRAMQATQA